jgi:hypothetical protein
MISLVEMTICANWHQLGVSQNLKIVMSMSVWFDNIAQLNSSRTALPRRAFSYSPAIQASRLEELREVLEEKFR